MSETRHASIVERRVTWQRTVWNRGNAVIAARRVMLQKIVGRSIQTGSQKRKAKVSLRNLGKDKKPTGRGTGKGKGGRKSKGRGKGNKFRGVDGEEEEDDQDYDDYEEEDQGDDNPEPEADPSGSGSVNKIHEQTTMCVKKQNAGTSRTEAQPVTEAHRVDEINLSEKFQSIGADRKWISKAHEAVLSETQSLSKQAWSQKQAKMKERLQNSFSENGGKDAFQRIKKESLPDISVLYRKVKFDLEPQRWEAEGCDVVLVRNSHAFLPDESFRCRSGKKTIVAVLRNRIVFDSKLSFEDARGIEKFVPMPHPGDIASEFLKGWNTYWCRDDPQEPPPEAFHNWLDTLPAWDPMPFRSIEFDEWRFSLKKAKAKSMRGADGFSVTELRRIPEGIFKLLNLFFEHAESTRVWPSILTKTWVILLPKCDCPLGLGIPMTVHWATMLDEIQFAHDSHGIVAGIVCDLLKAFNCLNRQVIFSLALKGGIPIHVINAWSGALHGLHRQVQIHGFLFGEEQASSTGFLEGDPLSVAALFILVWNFGASLHRQHQEIEFRAQADNLELVGHKKTVVGTSV